LAYIIILNTSHIKCPRWLEEVAVVLADDLAVVDVAETLVRVEGVPLLNDKEDHLDRLDLQSLPGLLLGVQANLLLALQQLWLIELLSTFSRSLDSTVLPNLITLSLRLYIMLHTRLSLISSHYAVLMSKH
jgi:hypothetical protein